MNEAECIVQLADARVLHVARREKSSEMGGIANKYNHDQSVFG
jgi:hypothetical protein